MTLHVAWAFKIKLQNDILLSDFSQFISIKYKVSLLAYRQNFTQDWHLYAFLSDSFIGTVIFNHFTNRAFPSHYMGFNVCINNRLMSQSIPTGYIPPGNPRGLAQKHCPGGRDLTFESYPGAGNSTRAGFCGNSNWNILSVYWFYQW